MRPEKVVELGIGPAAVGVDDGEVVGLAALQQFGGGVEALRIIEQQEFGLLVRRGQPVLDEAVEAHSGTTAVASISTLAAGSTRRSTSTSAIAG